MDFKIIEKLFFIHAQYFFSVSIYQSLKLTFCVVNFQYHRILKIVVKFDFCMTVRALNDDISR